MLVYDITNEKSFDNIKNWIRNIEEHASADVEKMILGNKCDMNDRRQVSKERGEELAIEYGIKFMETSAKASINVEEAFFTLARDIKAKMERRLVRGCFHFLPLLWFLLNTMCTSLVLSLFTYSSPTNFWCRFITLKRALDILQQVRWRFFLFLSLLTNNPNSPHLVQ